MLAPLVPQNGPLRGYRPTHPKVRVAFQDCEHIRREFVGSAGDRRAHNWRRVARQTRPQSVVRRDRPHAGEAGVAFGDGATQRPRWREHGVSGSGDGGEAALLWPAGTTRESSPSRGTAAPHGSRVPTRVAGSGRSKRCLRQSPSPPGDQHSALGHQLGHRRRERAVRAVSTAPMGRLAWISRRGFALPGRHASEPAANAASKPEVRVAT